jgi:hypothetical protein
MSTAAFDSGAQPFAPTSAIRSLRGTPGFPSVMSRRAVCESM